MIIREVKELVAGLSRFWFIYNKSSTRFVIVDTGKINASVSSCYITLSHRTVDGRTNERTKKKKKKKSPSL